VYRLERRIGSHDQQVVRAVGAADPGKLGIIELDLFTSHKLIKINGRKNRYESQTISRGYAINLIGCDDRTGAADVLHDNLGVPGNVLAQIRGDQTAILVIIRSRRTSHHELYTLALVERGLSLDVRIAREQKEKAKAKAKD